MTRSGPLLASLAFSCAAAAQQGDGTDVAVEAQVFKPARVAATPERIASLDLPDGFAIAPFATGLKNVRMISVAPNGDVYATRREQGDVVLLQDRDGDGRADGPARPVAHRAGAHGLAIRDGTLYLATVKEIFSARIRPDGTLEPLAMLVGDLPDGGQHPNRTLAFGPDGMLYVTVGSTCNACNETNPEHASVLRMSPDGKTRTIFASGLRNTLGIDWHPETGALWGFDQGMDYLGKDAQEEELNLLEQGRQYGWPHVYGDGGLNPQSTPPGSITKEQWRQMSAPMALGYTAHAAPMQLVFYRGGRYPREYQGDAFVTMRGSWNRKPASGYEVVRVRFEGGRPSGIAPFLTGFLSDRGRTHFARPVGLAQTPDGALLVGDDANGAIYRVTYRDGRAAASGAPLPQAPAEPMKAQAGKGVGVPLAMRRAETQAQGALQVRSQTIASDRPIPLKHSEYADGVSPQLSWTAVEGAQSYALVMEDPDAKPVTPFVHWVAWNIPANVHALPEGLQEQLQLSEPEGMRQGATSRGSPGYYGPRPPAGDPPHHYHVQVFALDTLLDLLPGATRDELLAAMRGHVLAKGELVGTYRQRVEPPK